MRHKFSKSHIFLNKNVEGDGYRSGLQDHSGEIIDWPFELSKHEHKS